MYLPRQFAETRPAVLHKLVRAHPLGLLLTRSAAGEMSADSIPFLLDAGAAGGPSHLVGHVARANPLWREARGDVDSLVVFHGAEAYVSPSFYASKAEHGKVVPTWNYMTVQARGRLRAIEDPTWLLALVARLTDRHESPRAQPWAVADAPAAYVESMLRAIVGIEIDVTDLVGKWKVSQNRSAADRAGVAQGLFGANPTDAAALAGLDILPAAE